MSLVNTINTEIKTKFPKIYKLKNNRLKSLLIWIYNRNFWIVLIVYFFFAIIIVLYTKYVDFNSLKILSIHFNDSVKTFTTGIITLVSINLFVTNLLFTHLKEDREDFQSIIDKKVNFKFLTYFGFTLIIFVLCLYFLNLNISNVDIKSNLIIFIFYSFIFYIFMLISLYNNVFNFINKNKRYEIIKDELKEEFYLAFYNNYFIKKFNKEYVDLMENKYNFKRFPILDNIEGINHYQTNLKKKRYLEDINTKQVSKISKSIGNNDKYYHFIELGRQYQKGKIKLFSLTNKHKFNYKKIYSFSTENKYSNNYNTEYLDKILKKINNNTLTNQYNELSFNLKMMEDIYSEYIELENEI